MLLMCTLSCQKKKRQFEILNTHLPNPGPSPGGCGGGWGGVVGIPHLMLFNTSEGKYSIVAIDVNPIAREIHLRGNR